MIKQKSKFALILVRVFPFLIVSFIYAQTDSGGRDIATDNAGNIYVTGWANDYCPSCWVQDFLTIKYDSNGLKQWVARRTFPSTSYTPGSWSIVVDQSGNVYVTGYAFGTWADLDCVTIKYNENGEEQWIARYDPGSASAAFISEIALDSFGNIFVTAYGRYIIKYDPAGNQLWANSFGTVGFYSGGNSAIAIDSLGNVYGAGTLSNCATIVKYDTSGSRLWLAQYKVPGSEVTTVYDIAVDPSENAYATGYCSGTNLNDYVTMKFPQNYQQGDNPDWVARYNPGWPYTYNAARAIGIDLSGNVYVTGVSVGSIPLGDCATIKYDCNGNQIWVRRYNGPDNDRDQGNDIAVDSFGNVYIGAVTTSISSGYDCATIKYDTNGTQLWSAIYDGGGQQATYDWTIAIALDSSGNVCVTGFSDWKCLLLKYDNDGNLVLESKYQPPVANAGLDQTVTDSTCPRGSETVFLNGSGSTDPNGTSDIVSYVWKENGSQIASGVTPTVSLSVGTHAIELTVTDNSGDSSTDTVIITIVSGTASQAVANLITKVASYNLQNGISNSLDQKLQNAQQALIDINQKNNVSAWNRLDAFRQECQAQSGKELTAEQAAELFEMASCIMSDWLY